MSARTEIDALEFVRSRRDLRGAVAVVSLVRLADTLYDTSGSLSYSLVGGYDSRSRPQLRLEASGTLHLRCQRCLGLLEFPLQISSRLLLRAGEEEDAAVDNPLAPDFIDASPELDVAGLVEDEILLSLPYAPSHAEGACKGGGAGAQPEAASAPDFAAKLAAWKKV